MIDNMKIIVAITLLIVFLIIANKTRTIKPTINMLLIILVEFIVTVILILLSFWAVNMSLKKAIITNVTNTRILSSEAVIVTGNVRNVGKYTIDEAILSVKFVNAVSGKAREKQRNRDGSEKENTFEKTFIIAKDLKPGEQRRFRASTNYPPYFRLAGIKTHLSWN